MYPSECLLTISFYKSIFLHQKFEDIHSWHADVAVSSNNVAISAIVGIHPELLSEQTSCEDKCGI